MSSNTKTHQFFKTGLHEWDELKVAGAFEEVDAKAILEIEIPQHDTCDRIAWTHTKKGFYSVKSGYRVWQDNTIQPSLIPSLRGGKGCGT